MPWKNTDADGAEINADASNDETGVTIPDEANDAVQAESVATADASEGQAEDVATPEQAEPAELTGEDVRQMVESGKPIPSGWAYNNRQGYFRFASLEIPRNAPLTVEAE